MTTVLPVGAGGTIAPALTHALDRAAASEAGLAFYSAKGAQTESLPYRHLRQQAIDLARRMLGAGLRRGERVALVAEVEGDFVRAFFACQYAGLVPVSMPLPGAFRHRDSYADLLRGMIQAAGAGLVLVPKGMAEFFRELAPRLAAARVGTLDMFDGAPSADPDLPPIGSEDIAYIQFSSGSTRFPQGVTVTQRAVMANAAAITRHGLRVRPEDRCVSWLPFYHDMGLVGFLLAPITSRTPVDYLTTSDFARRPLLWLQLIARNRATISYSPSFGYELCARRAEAASLDGLDLGSWRIAGIGGDMVRAHLLEKFAAAFAGAGFRREAFVASYGMAEAALALSFAPLDTGIVADRVDLDRLEGGGIVAPPRSDRGRSRSFVRCGRALPQHAIEVRGEAGAPLPEGHVGRIFARGPSLMRGYFRNTEATQRVLSPDGWLDTGDLGYLADGEIVIVGRAKDLILTNGRNVWSQDLEWSVERHLEPLRSGDVAAFSVEEDSGEKIVVLVQCRLGDESVQRNLVHEAAKVLRTAHGIEADVVLVGPHALPRTSSGKLSRSLARKMYLHGTYDAAPTLCRAG